MFLTVLIVALVVALYASRIGGVVVLLFGLALLTQHRPEPRAGWIYLISNGDDLVKIGRSKHDPEKRMKRIQGQAPEDLTLVHRYYTKDAASEEARLHRQFAAQRVHGEWFDLAAVCKRIEQEGLT